MINVGIIGCGKIADQHAEQINRISRCRIVAAVDSEPLMARQFCERFKVKQHFQDAGEMLSLSDVNVIHITTPPQSHFKLASQCIETGRHVYVEKPFTLYTNEAEALIELANANRVKLTVGHNAQFTHVAHRMRQAIHDGYLGGPPVHMDSYYCYNLSDPSYAKSLLGDENHWVRRMPGNLLQNIISHGVAKVAEFMKGNCPTVMAKGFTSRVLKDIGENQIVDEVRVIITDNESPATAYFTFSSQMKPTLHQFRLFGSRNGLIVDDDHQLLVKVPGHSYKSYLNQFIPPLIMARSYLGNFTHNIKSFITRDFYNDAGMKFLIENFYDSIRRGNPLPIPYREIILTSKIMDDIFSLI